MDKLDANDLQMLKAAADALREPQAVMNFVQRHLAAKYQLGPRDGVLSDGTIERAEPQPESP